MFLFFRCIQLCVCSEVRKTSTFFYIEFFTYKHKFPINSLTNDDHDAIRFFFVKCLRILLRDNVIMKIERDDEFQKNEKMLKNRFDFENRWKKKKMLRFKNWKKKCRNKIKHLNWTLWNEKNFRIIFFFLWNSLAF